MPHSGAHTRAGICAPNELFHYFIISFFHFFTNVTVEEQSLKSSATRHEGRPASLDNIIDSNGVYKE